MKTVALSANFPSVADLMQVARQESVVLRSSEGEEFFLALIDDFTKEVESLRQNEKFLVLPDERAARSNYIRVIDNEGEDYLYPVDYFICVDFPIPVEYTLLRFLEGSVSKEHP